MIEGPGFGVEGCKGLSSEPQLLGLKPNTVNLMKKSPRS